MSGYCFKQSVVFKNKISFLYLHIYWSFPVFSFLPTDPSFHLRSFPFRLMTFCRISHGVNLWMTFSVKTSRHWCMKAIFAEYWNLGWLPCLLALYWFYTIVSYENKAINSYCYSLSCSFSFGCFYDLFFRFYFLQLI